MTLLASSRPFIQIPLVLHLGSSSYLIHLPVHPTLSGEVPFKTPWGPLALRGFHIGNSRQISTPVGARSSDMRLTQSFRISGSNWQSNSWGSSIQINVAQIIYIPCSCI